MLGVGFGLKLCLGYRLGVYVGFEIQKMEGKLLIFLVICIFSVSTIFSGPFT